MGDEPTGSTRGCRISSSSWKSVAVYTERTKVIGFKRGLSSYNSLESGAPARNLEFGCPLLERPRPRGVPYASLASPRPRPRKEPRPRGLSVPRMTGLSGAVP